jgi:hypothetical protein
MGMFWQSDGPITRAGEGVAIPLVPLPAGPLPFAMVLAGAPVGAPLADRTGHQLILDPSGNLKVALGAPAPGGGKTAVQANATSAALGAGANTVPIRTVPAARSSRLLALAATYTGTVGGTTSLQIAIDGVLIDLPFGALTSAVFIRLLPAGMELVANAAQVWQIRVEGATATDTISWRAAWLEETT